MQKITPLKIVLPKLESVSILDELEKNPPQKITVVRINKFASSLYKGEVFVGRLLVDQFRDQIIYHEKTIIYPKYFAVGVFEEVLTESRFMYEDMVFNVKGEVLRTTRSKFLKNAIKEKSDYGTICYLQLYHISGYKPEQLTFDFIYDI